MVYWGVSWREGDGPASGRVSQYRPITDRLGQSGPPPWTLPWLLRKEISISVFIVTTSPPPHYGNSRTGTVVGPVLDPGLRTSPAPSPPPPVPRPVPLIPRPTLDCSPVPAPSVGGCPYTVYTPRSPSWWTPVRPPTRRLPSVSACACPSDRTGPDPGSSPWRAVVPPSTPGPPTLRVSTGRHPLRSPRPDRRPGADSAHSHPRPVGAPGRGRGRHVSTGSRTKDTRPGPRVTPGATVTIDLHPSLPVRRLGQVDEGGTLSPKGCSGTVGGNDGVRTRCEWKVDKDVGGVKEVLPRLKDLCTVLPSTSVEDCPTSGRGPETHVLDPVPNPGRSVSVRPTPVRFPVPRGREWNNLQKSYPWSKSRN